MCPGRRSRARRPIMAHRLACRYGDDQRAAPGRPGRAVRGCTRRTSGRPTQHTIHVGNGDALRVAAETTVQTGTRSSARTVADVRELWFDYTDGSGSPATGRAARSTRCWFAQRVLPQAVRWGGGDQRGGRGAATLEADEVRRVLAPATTSRGVRRPTSWPCRRPRRRPSGRGGPRSTWPRPPAGLAGPGRNR